ncbi:MAG: hypothetical protein R2762_22630 [Bryobacteraceae bacterium]
MTLSLEKDDFGRLICRIEDGDSRATITSRDATVLAEWISAIEDTPQSGYVDCYWSEQAGNYRWMFRLAGANLRIYVTWGGGAGQGWEYIYSSEHEAALVRRQARRAVEALDTEVGRDD